MHVEYSVPENHLTTTASNPWHERLGSPGNKAIRMMGLPVINSTCSTCYLNKMHMLPFDKHFEELKSDAFEQFVIVKNRMESLHDQKLKTLVSDQGGEFVNAKFKSLAESDGFVDILSPAKTPQHNGFLERANWTIIEKARCLLNGSNLPKKY
ncbi:hypothetical protein O181_023966 [Austropuccinia psidii MF-1]|uniref:Integrase catalytic domain-containing protein n=1 Tax=Austropuccinia psidii MF-1 TaxID=1389203 RepID=A0A9Q3CKF8_9BASI|nr:hypothetical protein [Austropuccinia psidii MF-1]